MSSSKEVHAVSLFLSLSVSDRQTWLSHSPWQKVVCKKTIRRKEDEKQIGFLKHFCKLKTMEQHILDANAGKQLS